MNLREKVLLGEGQAEEEFVVVRVEPSMMSDAANSPARRKRVAIEGRKRAIIFIFTAVLLCLPIGLRLSLWEFK